MQNTQNIINKALGDGNKIDESLQGSVFNRHQSKKFIQEMFPQNIEILKLVSYFQTKAMTGTFPMISVTEGNWRGDAKLTASGYDDPGIEANFTNLEFSLKKMRADMLIPNDIFRFNIEGAGLESTILNIVANQHSLDLNNLLFNGNTATTGNSFLSITDGIIVKLKKDLGENYKKQIIDYSAETTFDLKIFFDLFDAIPTKKMKGDYRWFMSKKTKTALSKTLLDRQTNLGDTAFIDRVGNVRPLDIGILEIEDFPDDVILLAVPSDFAICYYEQIRFAKAVQGMTLTQRDARYYAWFYWFDFLVLRADKMALAHSVSVPTNYKMLNEYNSTPKSGSVKK